MVSRGSLVRVNGFFLTGFSDLVEKIHDANLTLHVGVLKNEFMNFGFDYFADPMIEIATYSSALATDGIVTEFPSTAAAYFSKYLFEIMNIGQFQIAATRNSFSAPTTPATFLKAASELTLRKCLTNSPYLLSTESPCSDMTKNLSYSIYSANPGSLEKLVPLGALPPALPPAPVLEPADVIDPPLPPVAVSSPPESTPKGDEGASAPSSSPSICLLVAGIAAFLYLSSH
jgi:hypothetical protein